MTRPTKDLLKIAIASIAFIALVGWGGREDYTQEVISEMQNNGSYTRYVEAYPEATDADIAKLYLEERDK